MALPFLFFIISLNYFIKWVYTLAASLLVKICKRPLRPIMIKGC